MKKGENRAKSWQNSCKNLQRFYVVLLLIAVILAGKFQFVLDRILASVFMSLTGVVLPFGIFYGLNKLCERHISQCSLKRKGLEKEKKSLILKLKEGAYPFSQVVQLLQKYDPKGDHGEMFGEVEQLRNTISSLKKHKEILLYLLSEFIPLDTGKRVIRPLRTLFTPFEKELRQLEAKKKSRQAKAKNSDTPNRASSSWDERILNMVLSPTTTHPSDDKSQSKKAKSKGSKKDTSSSSATIVTPERTEKLHTRKNK